MKLPGRCTLSGKIRLIKNFDWNNFYFHAIWSIHSFIHSFIEIKECAYKNVRLSMLPNWIKNDLNPHQPKQMTECLRVRKGNPKYRNYVDTHLNTTSFNFGCFYFFLNRSAVAQLSFEILLFSELIVQLILIPDRSPVLYTRERLLSLSAVPSSRLLRFVERKWLRFKCVVYKTI